MTTTRIQKAQALQSVFNALSRVTAFSNQSRGHAFSAEVAGKLVL